MGAAHHGQVLKFIGPLFQDLEQLIEVGLQEVGGFLQAQGQGGIQYVRGSEPEVEIAAVLPQTGGHLVHKGGHVMMGLFFQGQDLVHVAGGLGGGPGRRLPGDEAALGHGRKGRQLYLEPTGIFVLFAPDAGHFLAAISGNHVFTSEKLSAFYKSVPA